MTPTAPSTGVAVRSRTGLPSDFWRQWWSAAISNLGDGINFVAMPLLAFSLTQDERLLALTAFASLVPWLLLAIPVGALVDRYDRRVLLIGSNTVRLALFAVVAVGAWRGELSIWPLLGILIVIGTAEVVFDSSAQAFVPALVPRHQLQRANGYLFAAEVVCGSMIGIAIGAFLFQREPGLPFALNAATFAIAVLLITAITTSGAPSIAPRGARPRFEFRTEMTVGLRYLRNDRLLRTLAILLAVTSFGLMLGQGIFVKYAAEELGLGGTGYGLLLMVTGLGAAIGGIVGPKLARRFGSTAATVVPYALVAIAQLVFVVAPVAWIIGVAGFVAGMSVTTWNVVTVSLRQQLIPRELFGRVNSVYRWVGTGAGAIGALIGGQIAFYGTLRSPYLVGGLVPLVALALLAKPLTTGLSSADLDDQPDGPATPAPPSMT